MKFYSLFYAFTMFFGITKGNQEQEKCDGVYVKGKCHEIRVLAEDLNRPYQLSAYHGKRLIFFSYNVGSDKEDTFKIGYIEKGIDGHKVINKVKNGFATAVDQENGFAYFGGSDGIYKCDLQKNISSVVKIINGHNIWDMFFKNHLYFISYPSQRLYKLNDKMEIERQEYIHETIYQFVIDGDGDTFITNNSGLYIIKSGSNKRIHYKGAEVFRAIEVNSHGEAHFCTYNAIYVANKQIHSLEEIVHIKNIFGLTFDKEDRIIYSNPRGIIAVAKDMKIYFFMHLTSLIKPHV